MNHVYRNRSLALLAGAAMFSAGAWALPPLAGHVTTRTEMVKYDPLRAATPEGAAELYGKLQKTAARVCADDPSAPPSRHFRNDTSLATCVEDALAEAVRRVGIPMVAVLHQQDGGREAAAMASR